MFETAELGRTLSKEEYDAQEPLLRTKLLDIQEDLKNASFPVIIIIGGVDGAGKSETVNLLHEWMDARYLQTHAFGPPTDEERERPEAWRFWRVLPPNGRIGIFFGSWYTRPIIDCVYGKTKPADLDIKLRTKTCAIARSGTTTNWRQTRCSTAPGQSSLPDT